MFWSTVFSVCVYFSLVVSQHCPEYSTYAECGCMLTCENPYPTDDCSENCEPGCYCNPGYLLRSDGQCVLHTQCNNPGYYLPNTPSNKYQCADDEQYYECTPSCKNTCENLNNPEDGCKCGPPGCFCREGLMKREDGKCVPPQECEVFPPQCPPNAIYIRCGSACAPTCEDPRLRSCGDKCLAACFCKPGYLLSKDEKACVQPQHCNLKEIPTPPEPKCPEHAVFIKCGSACEPTCEKMYPEPCGDECVTACFCIPGYLKNRNGTRCVRPDQCEIPTKPTSPPTTVHCGVDEQYYECTPSCNSTCKNYNNPDVNCGCGPPGCFCREGLVKREDGKCVRTKECPVRCGADEQYYECTPSCKNTCKNYNNPGVRCGCGPPGCFCREGLVKREDGKCVRSNQCPARCGADEKYYECTPSCKNTCKNYNNPRVKCGCGPPGCFCREGLVKRADGKCVRANQCPITPPICVENAVFLPCGSSCPKTCENPTPQPCAHRCVAGCFCKHGFLQTKEGKCVNKELCEKNYPTKCPENAVYQECGTSCPKTCEDSYPSRCTLECVAGCFCKPGFLKRNDGKCVTPQHCDGKDKPVRCGVDEQYYECTPSCKNTCKNHNNPGIDCPCGPPGCFCREGLVKREDGKCVRTNECPVRCEADEQYYECTPSCKNTCKNYNNPGVNCGCGPPGCFCREGLVKRADGKCVRTNQCPITPPKCVENAMFVPCGSPCPSTCDNPTPQPCSQRCVAGCFCKHGFLQTKDGKCVLPEQCEKKNVTRCREYAEYLKCGPACPETCENTQPQKPCIAACLPGCFCKSGFVQTKDGNCVPPNMCDKKCSIPGEEYLECGSTCPDTCDNRGHTPPGGCPSKCVRGCFCKKGLFRDLNGSCVAPKDCSWPMTSTSTETTKTSPEYGVTFGESRGCPDQKLCEAFCKSHKLRVGYCVGENQKECHCS